MFGHYGRVVPIWSHRHESSGRFLAIFVMYVVRRMSPGNNVAAPAPPPRSPAHKLHESGPAVPTSSTSQVGIAQTSPFMSFYELLLHSMNCHESETLAYFSRIKYRSF